MRHTVVLSHTVGHGGGQQGTSTGNVLAPGKSAAAVVLANMDNVDSLGLAFDLLRILLDLPDDAKPH